MTGNQSKAIFTDMMTFVNELNQHGNMDMVGRCSSAQLKTIAAGHQRSGSGQR